MKFYSKISCLSIFLDRWIGLFVLSANLYCKDGELKKLNKQNKRNSDY